MKKEFSWNDGKVDYDYSNDNLLIYSQSHKEEYIESIAFDDFIIDINKENQVVSYEFQNASKLFSIPKFVLMKGLHLNGKFKIDNRKVRIVIFLNLIIRYRNKKFISNFKRDIIEDDLRRIAPSSSSISI